MTRMKLRPSRLHAAAPWPPTGGVLRRALLEAAHDAYADWVEASSAVEQLYARWTGAKRGQRALAYAAYAAALEREEWAAAVYAETVRTAAGRAS